MRVKDRDPVFVPYQSDMSGIDRVESGMVQFPRDWPGLFIRGDDAIGVMFAIRSTLSLIKSSVSHLELATADVDVAIGLSKLEKLAELIDEYVNTGKKLPVRKGCIRNQSFRRGRDWPGF